MNLKIGDFTGIDVYITFEKKNKKTYKSWIKSAAIQNWQLSLICKTYTQTPIDFTIKRKYYLLKSVQRFLHSDTSQKSTLSEIHWLSLIKKGISSALIALKSKHSTAQFWILFSTVTIFLKSVGNFSS